MYWNHGFVFTSIPQPLQALAHYNQRHKHIPTHTYPLSLSLSLSLFTFHMKDECGVWQQQSSVYTEIEVSHLYSQTVCMDTVVSEW